MSKKDFSELEKKILECFKDSEKNQNQFTDKTTGLKEYIVKADKPTTEVGEPKTDIYALAKNETGQTKEIKISVKKKNADFLENKTNADRAQEILGKDWKKIISTATRKLKSKFENKCLVYFDNDGKTDKGSITLGWKFEILNKKSGELSDELNLTVEQKMDVYAGTNLPESKKNAKVDGEIVENSGVANYILVTDKDEVENLQSIIDELVPMSDFIEDSESSSLYFACKALNYRSLYNKNGRHGKYDGNRPLAVYVKWSAEDGKLVGKLMFDEPLTYGGNCSYNQLRQALSDLGVSDTDGLNENNVDAKIFKK